LSRRPENTPRADMLSMNEVSTRAPAACSPEMPTSPDAKKKDKEQRTYRVGLSYTCKRCGQPKKGHVCTVASDGAVGTGSSDGTRPKPNEKKRPAKEVTKSATPDASKASSDAKKDTAKRARHADAEEATPTRVLPPAATKALAAPITPEDSILLTELLDRVDDAQRPPTLVTPEDDEPAPELLPFGMLSKLSPPPASLASTTNLFSPGQFLTMLGTPAPAITPGLRFHTNPQLLFDVSVSVF